jgi:cytochrome P450 monooxygenase
VTSAQFAYALINTGKCPTAGDKLYEEVQIISNLKDETDEYARREDTFLHKMYLEILRSNPPICASMGIFISEDLAS